jgi:hypothetical protein
MIHLRYPREVRIEFFGLPGRLPIYADTMFPTKLMLLWRLGIEMGMVHGKPVNGSTSSANHFNLWRAWR